MSAVEVAGFAVAAFAGVEDVSGVGDPAAVTVDWERPSQLVDVL